MIVSGRLSYLCRRCGAEVETDLFDDLELEFIDALTSNPRGWHVCDDGIRAVTDIYCAYPEG